MSAGWIRSSIVCTRMHLLETYSTDGGGQAHRTFGIEYTGAYTRFVHTRIRTLVARVATEARTHRRQRRRPRIRERNRGPASTHVCNCVVRVNTNTECVANHTLVRRKPCNEEARNGAHSHIAYTADGNHGATRRERALVIVYVLHPSRGRCTEDTTTCPFQWQRPTGISLLCL